MASDNQIQLELIVDDKDVKASFQSIQKEADKAAKAVSQVGAGDQLGLPNFNNKLALSKVQVSGITESLQKMGQQSQITGSAISNIFTPEVLASGTNFGSLWALVTGPIGIATAAVATLALGFNKLQSEILAGEALKKVEKQFETLAAQAGIAATVLREDFKKAANGVVDDSDILKSANKALIDLGDSAARLPQVFALARKASSLFGGEVVDNFEKINNSVISGQTRQLRSIGLFVDQAAAVKKYADSIGVGVGAIDRIGTQQAILNAVLEKGNDQYRNINPNVDNATIASKRLGVAFTELGETISKVASQTFGDYFKGVNNSLTALAEKSNSFLKRIFNTQDATEAGKSLEGLQLKIKALETQALTFGGEATSPIGLRARLADFRKQAEELSAFVKSKADENTRAIASSTEAKPSSIGAAIKFNVDTSALQKAGIDAQQAAISTQLAANKTYQQIAKDLNESIKVQALKKEESILIDKEYALKKEALEIQLSNVVQSITSQSKSLQAQVDSEAKLQLEQTDASNSERRQQILEAAAAKRLEIQASAGQAIKAQQEGLHIQIESAEVQHKAILLEIENESAKKRALVVKQINDTMRSTLISGLSSTIQKMGQALVAGEDLFQNFGASVVGVIGDLAINVGNILIAQGLAIEAFITSINTLLPGSGFAAAAAGVGLVLFGSVLKALVGKGGGSTASAASNSGGGIGFNPSSPASQLPSIADQKPTDPKTTINLNIQGNVLDRRQTGLELADILTETFSGQGLQVKGGFA